MLINFKKSNDNTNKHHWEKQRWFYLSIIEDAFTDDGRKNYSDAFFRREKGKKVEAVIRSCVHKIESNRFERRKRRLLFTQARWKEEVRKDSSRIREVLFADGGKKAAGSVHTKANRNFLLRWRGREEEERKIGESFVPWIILFKQALMSTFFVSSTQTRSVYTSRIFSRLLAHFYSPMQKYWN